MADKPQIEIGISLEQIKAMSARAAKSVRDTLGKALEDSAKKADQVAKTAGKAAGGGSGKLPGGVPDFTEDPRLKRKAGKGGFLSSLLFGERGEAGTVRGIKSSLLSIGDSISNALGGSAGLGGMATKFAKHGLVGGAGMAAVGAATAGITGSLLFGRHEERSMMRLAPLLGKERAHGALAQGRGALFSEEETIGFGSSLARQGAQGGLGSVLRGERGLGVGNQLSELLGAKAVQGQKVDRKSSLRELSQAVGVGVATNLDRGRLGEIMHGMAQMMSSRGLGQGINTGGVAQGLKMVGSQFKGAQGFQAIQALENAERNPTTALGKSIALRTAGYGGRFGGDIFKAERQQELGFFGQQKVGGETRMGSGRGGMEHMLMQYRKAFGFGDVQKVGKEMQGDDELKRGAMIKEMSQNMGISQNTTEALVQAIENSKSSSEDLKKIIEGGKSLQDKAYNAMIKMGTFANLEATFKTSFDTLWHEGMEPLLKRLLPLIEKLLEYFTPKAASAIRDVGEGIDTLSTKKGRAKLMSTSLTGIAGTAIDQATGFNADANSIMGASQGSAGQALLAKMSRRKLSGLGPNEDKDNVSEQMAADVVKRLSGITEKGSQGDIKKAQIVAEFSPDQLHQLAKIIQAMARPIVNVHDSDKSRADGQYHEAVQGATPISGGAR